MGQEEYEKLYREKWGHPSWEEFSRDAFARGVSHRDALAQYARLSRESLTAQGLVD